MQTEPAARPSGTKRRGLVGLEQRLLSRARASGCPAGTTVIVGFSGGADSLALAAALGAVGPRLGLTPLLAHVDHGLRDGSRNEQEAARRLAGGLGLPFVGLRADGDVGARHPGVGLEEAARRERYRLLAAASRAAGTAAVADVASKVAGDAATVAAEHASEAASDEASGVARGIVALAHHASDQAETVLLHLLRGAGPSGAIGMAERSERAVPWWADGPAEPAVPIVVWRPFLGEARRVVRAYAAALALAPVEDPSNRDTTLRRNALRHEGLPMLERISPGATEALARYGRLVNEEDEALETLAARARVRGAAPAGGLRLAALSAEPTAIRRRVVRRWLWEQTGMRGATADRTEAVLGLIGPGDGGRRVEVGEGWTVRDRGGVLRVGRSTDGEGRGS